MLLLRSVLVVAYGVDILVVVVGYVVITIVAFGGVLRVRSPSTWPRGAVGSLGHQNVPIHLPWVVSALMSWQGTGCLLEHYPSPVVGVGRLVYTVSVAFKALLAMAGLGDVAIASCRLRGGRSASARNGDGRVLTLGGCDMFPPHCWPSSGE